MREERLCILSNSSTSWISKSEKMDGWTDEKLYNTKVWIKLENISSTFVWSDLIVHMHLCGQKQFRMVAEWWSLFLEGLCILYSGLKTSSLLSFHAPCIYVPLFSPLRKCLALPEPGSAGGLFMFFSSHWFPSLPPRVTGHHLTVEVLSHCNLFLFYFPIENILRWSQTQSGPH